LLRTTGLSRSRDTKIFHREAGPLDAPVLLLLHGFPTNSHMFRDLIPRLANRYHVIAPDHLGFGYSAIPAADSFEYSFSALASLTIAFRCNSIWCGPT
jgi:pimeloyl-ACP methyl ester carboxylesterase